MYRRDSGEKNEGRGGHSWPGGLAQELALAGQVSSQESGCLEEVSSPLRTGKQAGKRKRATHARGRGRT